MAAPVGGAGAGMAAPGRAAGAEVTIRRGDGFEAVLDVSQRSVVVSAAASEASLRVLAAALSEGGWQTQRRAPERARTARGFDGGTDERSERGAGEAVGRGAVRGAARRPA
ncbi:MAG: hypothetical protein R3F65_31835 [bacterium]